MISTFKFQLGILSSSMHLPLNFRRLVSCIHIFLSSNANRLKGRTLADEGVDVSTRYTTWNEHLLQQAKEFTSDTPRATVSLLSSHLILSAVLEQPDWFGLRINQGGEDASGVSEESDENRDQLLLQFWEDNLHISETMHAILARSFASAMSL